MVTPTSRRGTFQPSRAPLGTQGLLSLTSSFLLQQARCYSLFELRLIFMAERWGRGFEISILFSEYP